MMRKGRRGLAFVDERRVQVGDIVNWHTLEQGHLVRHQVQPTRNAVLERNATIQREPEALRRLDWASWQLSIPELDMKILAKKHPELMNPDGPTRKAAWKRFIESDEADPYRVRARTKARRGL